MQHARQHLLLMLIASACYVLPGCSASRCETVSTANPEAPPAPVIAGDWSEPVNGLRLAVRQIVSATDNRPDVTLLLMAQNVTDKPVDWPGFIPEPEVLVDGAQPPKAGGSNLRVLVEQLEPKRAVPAAVMKSLSQQLQQYQRIEPGQVSLHALHLHSDARLMHMMQQSNNTIYADQLYWPGLDDKRSVGTWRLQLIYQPDGFWEGEAPASDEHWKGVCIELPVITLQLKEWQYGGPVQQLQQSLNSD